VGLLYILGTVAGVLSLVVMQGRLDGPAYLERMASDATPVMVGALLVLLMGLALALVPVVVFPILKRHSGRWPSGTSSSEGHWRRRCTSLPLPAGFS